MEESPVILFDGVCNLCNGFVQYVIKHDRRGLFKFASLQSQPGQELLRKFSLPASNFNSFVVVKDGKAFTKSDAALLVAKHLDGPVRLLYGLKIVPSVIRNSVYNFIANNRYKWFGKKDSCMIPQQSIQSRFL